MSFSASGILQVGFNAFMKGTNSEILTFSVLGTGAGICGYQGGKYALTSLMGSEKWEERKCYLSRASQSESTIGKVIQQVKNITDFTFGTMDLAKRGKTLLKGATWLAGSAILLLPFYTRYYNEQKFDHFNPNTKGPSGTPQEPGTEDDRIQEGIRHLYNKKEAFEHDMFEKDDPTDGEFFNLKTQNANEFARKVIGSYNFDEASIQAKCSELRDLYSPIGKYANSKVEFLTNPDGNNPSTQEYVEYICGIAQTKLIPKTSVVNAKITSDLKSLVSRLSDSNSFLNIIAPKSTTGISPTQASFLEKVKKEASYKLFGFKTKDVSITNVAERLKDIKTVYKLLSKKLHPDMTTKTFPDISKDTANKAFSTLGTLHTFAKQSLDSLKKARSYANFNFPPRI